MRRIPGTRYRYETVEPWPVVVVIVDPKGRTLGHAQRLGGQRNAYRVTAPDRRGRGRVVEVGVVPSLAWAAYLLAQHRATGRRQATGYRPLHEAAA